MKTCKSCCFRCYLRKDYLNSQESEGIRMMDPFMRYVPLTCGCSLLGRRTDDMILKEWVRA